MLYPAVNAALRYQLKANCSEPDQFFFRKCAVNIVQVLTATSASIYAVEEQLMIVIHTEIVAQFLPFQSLQVMIKCSERQQ